MNKKQLINFFGLIVGFASFYFELLTPFWGVVFFLWLYRGLKNGNMTLFYDTNKQDNPVLYWLLVVLWAMISLYFLMYPY